MRWNIPRECEKPKKPGKAVLNRCFYERRLAAHHGAAVEDNTIHTRLLSKIKHTSLFEYDMKNMHVKEHPAGSHLPARKLQLIPTTSCSDNSEEQF
jgi:hypothetical protein